MAASIDDVARTVGVSTATVSRALRGLPGVSEATRARVVAAAREMDYVVSPSASSLASGRTRTVGVVTPYSGRWFFGQVIAAVEQTLRDAGYDLLLYTLPAEHARRRFFDALPLRRRVDGVLVLSLPLSQTEVGAIGGLGVPVGLLGARSPGLSSIRIDDVGGTRMAVEHLLALGHRRIAMIGGGSSEPTYFVVPEDRRTGYQQAMSASGITPDPTLIVDGGFTVAGGESAMTRLLSLRERPTAVFCASDEMAFGALRAIRLAGLACPEDISVIGFDDHEMAWLLDLSTVAQSVFSQGELLVRLLLAEIDGGQPRDLVSPLDMRLRGSTSPPGAPPVLGPMVGPLSGRAESRRGAPRAIRLDRTDA